MHQLLVVLLKHGPVFSASAGRKLLLIAYGNDLSSYICSEPDCNGGSLYLEAHLQASSALTSVAPPAPASGPQQGLAKCAPSMGILWSLCHKLARLPASTFDNRHTGGPPAPLLQPHLHCMVHFTRCLWCDNFKHLKILVCLIADIVVVDKDKHIAHKGTD